VIKVVTKHYISVFSHRLESQQQKSFTFKLRVDYKYIQMHSVSEEQNDFLFSLNLLQSNCLYVFCDELVLQTTIGIERQF